MARALFPEDRAAGPASNVAQPGKQFAQPESPHGRVDLLRSTLALPLSNEPVVRCSATSLLRIKASAAGSAALPARVELPAEIPCPACDPLRPARALRWLKD